MREIKFRDWHKPYKEDGVKHDGYMNYNPRYGSVITINEAVDYKTKEKHIYKDLYLNECLAVKDSILMQFTGLKDKKGKEIYEGDIFRYTTSTPKTHTAKVIWAKSEIGWRMMRDDGDPELNLHHFAKNYEIIGNIYENPNDL